MSASLETVRLILKLDTPADLRAKIASMPPEVRAQLSADWLAKAEAAEEASPWVHGFSIFLTETNAPVGQCGFKGPPENGAVEIAYGVDPERQGKGYATEAAAALTNFAFTDDRVSVVRAHTLPEQNASTRVLTKCGFRRIGEVIDPEDGPVWRWEKTRWDHTSG